MQIYVNAQFEVLSLDTVPENYSEVFETEKTRTELFNNLCDAAITGYKYAPQYELLFNHDGTPKRDDVTGEHLCKLDSDGNKILHGHSCYPFIDYKTLMIIQKQYEDSQKQTQALNAQIEYLSMMSGIETEVAHE